MGPREDRRRPRPAVRVLVGAARDRTRLPRARHLAPRPRRPRRTRAPRGHPPCAPEEAALLPLARPRPADRRTPVPRGTGCSPAATTTTSTCSPAATTTPTSASSLTSHLCSITSHFARHRCCSPCGCSSCCSTATPTKPRSCSKTSSSATSARRVTATAALHAPVFASLHFPASDAPTSLPHRRSTAASPPCPRTTTASPPGFVNTVHSSTPSLTSPPRSRACPS